MTLVLVSTKGFVLLQSDTGAFMQDMKFIVKSEQHSKEIQECLLKLGFVWIGRHSKTV